MESVNFFLEAMKELKANYGEFSIEAMASIAAHLVLIEMQRKTKEGQAERQAETYKLMAEAIKAYIETLKKPDFPFPLTPHPVIYGGLGFADPGTEPSALDGATGIGEDKNVESDAEPVPESQG
jgi:hypothetical protein